MEFKRLAGYFEKLEGTASRISMTEILAQVFKEANAEEIDKICYLSLGRLVPLYENLEFQLAEKMVMRAIARAIGKEVGEVTKLYKQKGDLGLVVDELTQHKNSKTKSVGEVYQQLRQIAEDSGEKSQERKVNGLAELLKDVDGMSGKYIVRMVVGKMRLGFSDKTIIDGLSWMMKGDKSLREELEAAYFVRADIGALARDVKTQNSNVKTGLKKIGPELGIPVMPALCQRLKTADEMISKMGEVAVEPKFDGTRVQIHLRITQNSKLKTNDNWTVKTFTRNMEESTAMFPELKQAYKQVKAKEVILDSEAVGWDAKTKKLLSFQQTMVRKRKHQVEETSRRIPLKFFVFDVLYKNGQSLIGESLKKRRKILEEVLGKGEVLELTEQMVTSDAGKLREYHAQQLAAGLEGVVVKKIDSPYTPGRRGWSWVKFKEEEKAAGKLADTLDVVVMGYYRGRGKRTGFGIGAFLAGVRKGEELVTIAKIGTGLTDAQWKELKLKMKDYESKTMPKTYVVDKSLIPDVWCEPRVVVEVAADNLTNSPKHSAGVALRFPRLVRFREDKAVAEATSLSEVKQLG